MNFGSIHSIKMEINDAQAQEAGNIHLIFVEGNIGSGKTTALREFQQNIDAYVEQSGCNVVIFEEPVDQWADVGGGNLLQWFYENMDKSAFQFELFIASIRISGLLKKISEVDTTDGKDTYIVVERSLLAQRYCFLRLHDDIMPQELMTLLQDLLDTMLMKLAEYSMTVIYLKVAPSVCLQRIRTRGRGGEEGIELAFLELLDRFHTTYLVGGEEELHLPKCPLVCCVVENKERCIGAIDMIISANVHHDV